MAERSDASKIHFSSCSKPTEGTDEMPDGPKRRRPIWVLIPLVLLVVLFGSKLLRMRDEMVDDLSEEIRTQVESGLRPDTVVVHKPVPDSSGLQTGEEAQRDPIVEIEESPPSRPSGEVTPPAAGQENHGSGVNSGQISVGGSEIKEETLAVSQENIEELEGVRDSLGANVVQADSADSAAGDPASRMIDEFSKGTPGVKVIRETK